MKTRCPECGKEQSIPDQYEDKKVRCQFCSKEFIAIRPFQPKYTPTVPPPSPTPETDDSDFLFLRPLMPGIFLQIVGFIFIFLVLATGSNYQNIFSDILSTLGFGFGIMIIALGSIAKLLGRILWNVRKSREIRQIR